MLAFGNIFFKSEILSLNWQILPTLPYKFRLKNIIFFITPLKKSDYSIKILNIITKSLFNYAFVLDTYYHKNTLNYLNDLGVLTMGPVPVIYNAKNLDIALPITADNIFLQYFFIKCTLIIKKFVEYKKYNFKIKLWSNWKTIYINKC
jgi:hypothetical protein